MSVVGQGFLREEYEKIAQLRVGKRPSTPARWECRRRRGLKIIFKSAEGCATGEIAAQVSAAECAPGPSSCPAKRIFPDGYWRFWDLQKTEAVSVKTAEDSGSRAKNSGLETGRKPECPDRATGGRGSDPAALPKARKLFPEGSGRLSRGRCATDPRSCL